MAGDRDMTTKREFLEKWSRVNALQKASRKSEAIAKRSASPAPAGGSLERAQRMPAPASAPQSDIAVEAAPAPPTLVPFADMDFWYLSSEMTWTLPKSALTVHVPRGFVTDFASVPSSFWSWMPPVGRYGLPAIVHDWLYWDQKLSRGEADDIFDATLGEVGVSTFRKFILYRSVRWFGGKYWRENTSAKAAGQGRVLQVFPTDARVTWGDWCKKPGVFG